MNLHRQNIPSWPAWILSALIVLTALARPALGQEKIVKTKLLDKQTTIKITGLSDPDSQKAYKLRIGENDISVDSKNARRGNVYVAKTDTIEDDLVTRGGSITVDGVIEGDCVALGGSVTVNGEVQGDVAAFGGGVAVAEQGEVGGKIASFGGSADILGKAGDLACIGGSVSLGPKAVIDGDVASMGGTIDKKTGAKVSGEIKALSFGMFDQFIPGAIHLAEPATEPHRPANRALGFIAALIVAAAFSFLALLVALFFPRQVAAVADAATSDLWKAIGVGLLLHAAFVPVLVLLLITIVGPLLLAVLYIAGWFISGVAFCLLISRRLFPALGKPVPGIIPAVLSGFVFLVIPLLLGSLFNIFGSPLSGIGVIFNIVGYLLLWFGITIGLGATWCTRFGTRNTALPVPPANPASPVDPAPLAPPAQIESGRSGIA